MKGWHEEVSKALKNIKRIINFKLIEESQNDQCTKYSVFDDLQDGNKQNFVPFMV